MAQTWLREFVMCKRTGSILLLLLTTVLSRGQTWETGINAGVANYIGDISPSLAASEFQPFGGYYLRKNLSGFFAWKVQVNGGFISGDDANFEFNEDRNLSFRTFFIEGGAQIEFNFQRYVLGLRAKSFSPFVFTGLMVTYYNPQAELDGTYYDLQPLNTEGQGLRAGAPNPYSLVTPTIPMGLGIKWKIARHLSVDAYMAFRYAFTDYLDDVSTEYYDNALLLEQKGPVAAALADRSLDGFTQQNGKQRGNSDDNDWYFLTGLSISYVFRNPSCPAFKSKYD